VRFLQTGDVASNPTLREGDAIIVPAVDERVDVYGRLHFPGRYEYRRGDLEPWVPRLEKLTAGGRTVHAIMTTTPVDGAGRSASLLVKVLTEEPEPERPDPTPQKGKGRGRRPPPRR